jgi:hypothetical protein
MGICNFDIIFLGEKNVSDFDVDKMCNHQHLCTYLGVFVITHIQSCRNGAGYCILGYSCDVDKGSIL